MAPGSADFISAAVNGLLAPAFVILLKLIGGLRINGCCVLAGARRRAPHQADRGQRAREVGDRR
jgi:hypothetical protein